MPAELLAAQACEGYKASVHGLAGALAFMMGGYNFGAWMDRHEPHLLVNTLVYAALVVWEWQHVKHHLQTE